MVQQVISKEKKNRSKQDVYYDLFNDTQENRYKKNQI
jgi:hypothetical protein